MERQRLLTVAANRQELRTLLITRGSQFDIPRMARAPGRPHLSPQRPQRRCRSHTVPASTDAHAHAPRMVLDLSATVHRVQPGADPQHEHLASTRRSRR